MPKKAKNKAELKKNTSTSATTNKSLQVKATKASSVTKARSKRLTPKQKEKILNYVFEVNAEKGRGGAAAASRKFGVSQITIGQWIKKSGKSTAIAMPATKKAGKSSAKVAGKTKGSFSAKLLQLTKVHEAIIATESKLASLQEEYAKLKQDL